MTNQQELKPRRFDRSELARCHSCGKGVLHRGDVHFYEVQITQCFADAKSIREQQGLEMLMGNPTISASFAPSTNVAYRMPSVRRLLCAECALTKDMPIAVLAEDS